MTELEEKAIALSRLWKDAGKPKHGPIHTKYKRDKLLFKKRIREERRQETNSYSNGQTSSVSKRILAVAILSSVLDRLSTIMFQMDPLSTFAS